MLIKINNNIAGRIFFIRWFASKDCCSNDRFYRKDNIFFVIAIG